MYIPDNVYDGWEEDIVSESINVTLINGSTETTIPLSKIQQNSLTITDNICSGGKFHTGGVISKMLTLKLLDGTGLNFYGAEISVTVTYTLNDDTEIVYPMGVFGIDTNAIEKGRSYISLTAYDRLTRLDKAVTTADEQELNAIIQALPNVHSLSGANYPIWKYIKFAAEKCNLTIDQNAFEALNSFSWTLYSDPATTASPPIGLKRAVSMGATYRDVVSSAAALAGCAVRLDRNGVIVPVSFLPRQTPDVTYTANNVISRNINDHYGIITSVTYGSWNTYNTASISSNSNNVDEVKLSLPSNCFLNDTEDDYSTKSYAEKIIKLSVDKTLTGISNDLRLLNAEIKHFGNLGLDAGDYVLSQQTWLDTQQVGFFVMENVWKPHGSCYIRSFGTPSSSVYTNGSDYGQATRTTRTNITTIEKVTQTQAQIADESSYTTSEHSIGTWIDGRVMFEKTYVFNSLGLRGVEAALDITDLKDIVESRGQVVNSSYAMPMPVLPIGSDGESFVEEDAVSYYVDFTQSKLIIEHGTTDRSNDKAYITLRYVKNTQGAPIRGIATTTLQYNNIPIPAENIYYAIIDGLVNSIVLNEVIETTQADYDSMDEHPSTTLYIIKEDDTVKCSYVGNDPVDTLLFNTIELYNRIPSWFPKSSDWYNITWFDQHEGYNPKYYVQFGAIIKGKVAVLRYTTSVSRQYVFEYNDSNDTVSSNTWVSYEASGQYAFYENGVWTRNTGYFIKASSDTQKYVTKIFVLNKSIGIGATLINIPFE